MTTVPAITVTTPTMTTEERAALIARLEAISVEALSLENARLMFVAGAIYASEKAIEIVKQIGD
jgi:hypothetical protein